MSGILERIVEKAIFLSGYLMELFTGVSPNEYKPGTVKVRAISDTEAARHILNRNRSYSRPNSNCNRY